MKRKKVEGSRRGFTKERYSASILYLQPKTIKNNLSTEEFRDGGGQVKMKNKIYFYALIAIVFGLTTGCGTTHNLMMEDAQAMAPASSQMPSPSAQAGQPGNGSDYIIQPGNQLDIKFLYNPELNETLPVRPDGKISLQLVDDVQAAGLTPTELDKVLTDKFSRQIRKPELTIIVKSFTGQQVYVGGEVNQTGLVDLMPGMTALQAVISAKGFKETAKPENAILIRKGENNQPMALRVNLNNALYGKESGPGARLQPFDVVYVPKSEIAKANKFVQQYIQDLFLFNGLSLGYSLNDNNNN